MRTFIFMLIFILYMILTPVFMIPYLFLYPFSSIKSKRYVSSILSITMKVILYLVGIRLHVRGFENFPKDPTKPILLVSNHQSVWDIAVLLAVAVRPIGFISKKEIAWIFPLAIWMKALGCLFIDRKRPRSAISTMEKAENNLKKGSMVAIFPEGTRSCGREMLEFKRGSFKIALKTGASILPVTISGSYKAWEDKGCSVRSADIYLVFHPLVSIEGASQKELECLPERTWEMIHSELEDLKKLSENSKTYIVGGIVYE